MAKPKIGCDCIGVGCGVFIVNDNGETLLLKRSKKSKNEAGFWCKPGGAVEFGETIDDSIRREIREELDVELGKIDFLSYTDHILPDENQHWVAFNFMAKIKSGEPKIMEPEKCDSLKWFKFDDVPEKLAMPTKESLPLMIKKYWERYGK